MNTFMQQFPSKTFRLPPWILCVLVSGVGLGLSMSDSRALAETSQCSLGMLWIFRRCSNPMHNHLDGASARKNR